MNISNETDPSREACNIIELQKSYSITFYDMVLHIISVLFGLPTHSYIIWLIVRGTERGLASEFFNLNISICEFVFCLRSVNTVLGNTYLSFWKVRIFLSGFVATARLFQCLMCVERYLAVVHPVTFLKYKPLRYKLACSIATWIMIILFCVVSLELANLCLLRIYKWLYLSHYLSFLAVNMFCCLAVLRALKKRGPGEKGKEREEENHIKRRAFYLILITTVTLILTYVPSSITTLQYVVSGPASKEMESLTLTFFFLPGFVHPLLFIRRAGKLPFFKST